MNYLPARVQSLSDGLFPPQKEPGKPKEPLYCPDIHTATPSFHTKNIPLTCSARVRRVRPGPGLELHPLRAKRRAVSASTPAENVGEIHPLRAHIFKQLPQAPFLPFSS